MSLPLGGWELLLLILIAIILFGPQKIPQLAKAVGEAVREFRKASSGVYEEEKKKTPEDYKELILELARKMNIETKGKDIREIMKEVLKKAKEEGLYEEALKKLEEL